MMKKKTYGNRKGDEKSSASLLQVYARLWAVATACRVLSRAGTELVLNEYVAVACGITFLFPMSPVALMIGVCMRVYALFASLPYIHDSQYWCLQTDLAFLIAILSTLVQRYLKKGLRVFASFDDPDADVLISRASATIWFQFLMMYTAAALLKVNSAFMDSHYSCAPIYLIQLLDQHFPSGFWDRYPDVIQWVTSSAPTQILLVEAIVPFLLFLYPRSGVAFTAFFHWMIAITPPPNGTLCFTCIHHSLCVLCLFPYGASLSDPSIGLFYPLIRHRVIWCSDSPSNIAVGSGSNGGI